MPFKQTLHTSKKGIHHLGKMQRAATSWVKETSPISPLKKRRLRDNLVLTHKIIYNQIELEATQLFNFSRRTDHHLDCFIENGEPDE